MKNCLNIDPKLSGSIGADTGLPIGTHRTPGDACCDSGEGEECHDLTKLGD